MKILLLTSISAIALTSLLNASAEGRRSFGDAWYDLEKQYPSPERRYTRKELDKARRRANNPLWLKTYGRRDPIYQSDQYRGRSRSSRYHYSYNPQPVYRNYPYMPGF